MRSQPKPVQAADPDPRRAATAPRPPAGPVGSATASSRSGLAGELLDRRWAQVQAAAVDAGRDPASVSLTLGGLLGDDAAITAAVDRGAERVVLTTRTADLDELRHAMDAAVALAARL